jgi:hypothetical protein
VRGVPAVRLVRAQRCVVGAVAGPVAGAVVGPDHGDVGERLLRHESRRGVGRGDRGAGGDHAGEGGAGHDPADGPYLVRMAAAEGGFAVST